MLFRSVAYAVHTGGRLTINLAMAWGLAWIAVGRWQGPLEDSTVAPVAAVSAAVVLLAAIVVRVRRPARTPSASSPAVR